MKKRIGLALILALGIAAGPLLLDVGAQQPGPFSAQIQRALQAGLSAVSSITFVSGGAIRTGTTAGNTLLLQAYDTDTGPAYTTLLTLTAGTTPSMTGLFGAGTLAAPSVAVGESDTGMYLPASGYLDLVVDGIKVLEANTGAGGMSVRGPLVVGQTLGSNIFYLYPEANNIVQLGIDAAGTTAYTLKGNDRITSSGVGGDLTIAAGRGYDAAAGGSLYFQTAPTAGAGAAGTLATRLTIAPSGGATFASDLVTNSFAQAGTGFYMSSRGHINAPSTNGVVLISNGGITGLDTLNLGPPTGNTTNGTLSISKVQVTCTIATDTNCSGKGTATITTSTGIPAGSLVLGVDARVTTIIAGSDGIATWNLGTAADPDAWGSALALAATTTTGIANFTVTAPAYYTSATNITFTGTGGKVIDSGVIKITIYYVALTPISA